ncbi:MAG: cysteine desulfurase family protein [Thermoguttaceae bacterium]|jgi:cysteine desulfurase
MRPPVYFDNHATTRVDPRVVEAMLPYFSAAFGNAGSTTHGFGRAARQAVDDARARIAAGIGAEPPEIVFTSGATESNNLALRGVAGRQATRGRHLLSVATEHPSVLEPLETLRRRGFEVTLLPVVAVPDPRAGLVRLEQVAEAIRPDTILVSIMLANNETGAIAPLAEIGRLCRERGTLLHSDATQAVGKIPVDVGRLGVDLLSFSAHKMYGPKGAGVLWVRSQPRRVRLEPQIEGGGQEGRLRSGTLNVPGIVGLAAALDLCLAEMPAEAQRLRGLRERLYAALAARLAGVSLNGPVLDPPELRLPGNLNLSFQGVEGETLLLQMPDVAVSSGSACNSGSLEPSHVLRAMGLTEETVRGGVRFGLGRFNTAEEVDFVVARTVEAVQRLRAMGG